LHINKKSIIIRALGLKADGRGFYRTLKEEKEVMGCELFYAVIFRKEKK